jgi:hypothetical protein
VIFLFLTFEVGNVKAKASRGIPEWLVFPKVKAAKHASSDG